MDLLQRNIRKEKNLKVEDGRSRNIYKPRFHGYLAGVFSSQPRKRAVGSNHQAGTRKGKGGEGPGAFQVFSYEDVATVIQSHKLAVAGLKDSTGENPFRAQGIVALARGGIIPGGMAASRDGLPMYLLGITRKTTVVEWLGRRPEANPDGTRFRAIVVDDFVSSGDSLRRALRFLEQDGLEVRSEVLFYDRGKSTVVPDVGEPIAQWACFPWDNLETKPKSEKEREQINMGVEEREKLAFAGSMLEAEISSLRGMFPAQTGILVVDENGKVKKGPGRLGLEGAGQEENRQKEAGQEKAGQDMAMILLREGVSCFFTDRAEQAVEVANQLPSMGVYWWNRKEGRAFSVRANQSLKL